MMILFSSDIMRDNMLVNPSGLLGHAMGIDMNIEHLIRYLKVFYFHICYVQGLMNRNKQTLFAAKGIYSNWDRLSNIAAGVNYLQLVKKQVMNSLKSGYRGSTHTNVNTSALVWQIARKANELELQTVIINRDDKSTVRPVVDVVTAGYRKFQTSLLATFNKKVTDMRQGKSSESEVDEIAPCQVVDGVDADESEPTEELSEVHDDE
jgi:hypothetical protein